MFRRALFVSLGLAASALVACSPPPPPPVVPKEEPKPDPNAEIPKEPVDTGKPCAKAESQCGGGVCAIHMENGCEGAVTCDFTVVMVCQAETDLVQAKARKHETFAAGAKEGLSIAADCAGGRIVSTKVESAACK